MQRAQTVGHVPYAGAGESLVLHFLKIGTTCFIAPAEPIFASAIENNALRSSAYLRLATLMSRGGP